MKRKLKKKYFIFLIICLAIPINLYSAQRNFSRIYFGASVDDSIYTVTKNDVNSAKLFSSSRKINPSFGYEILPKPFIDSWGLRVLRWSIGIGAQQFHANRQVLTDGRITDGSGEDKHNAGDEINLGSEIKGSSYYLTPALYLYFEPLDWLHAYLGFGAGGGYSNLKGNYYLTDGADALPGCRTSTTVSAVQTNCERRSVSFKKTSVATTAFAGATLGFLGFRIARGGPTYTDNGSKHVVTNHSGSIFFHFQW